MERDEWFSRMVEGELSPEEFAQLEDKLRESTEWREAYLDFIDVHSLIGLNAAPGAGQGGGVVSMKEVLRHQHARALKISAVAAAVVLLLGGVALHMMRSERSRQLAIGLEVAPSTVFHLEHSGGAGHVGEGPMLTVGSSLVVDQGVVELSFPSGVRSVVVGPAVVEAVSESEVRLQEGLGWFDVPVGAEGFSVEAPDCRAVDLGTTFGVAVVPGRPTEIHVMDGVVRGETDSLGSSEVLLEEGQAAVVSGDDGWVLTEFEEGQFMSLLPDTLPYVHWSFDRVEDGRFLAEGVHMGGDFAHARSERLGTGLQLVDGRFGNAVRFDGTKGQQLRTRLNGIEGARARTTACWIRTDIAPSTPTGKDIGGLIGWGLCQNDGDPSSSNSLWVMTMGHGGNLVTSGGSYYPVRRNLADGEWHHVACVARPIDNQDFPGGMLVTVYIDGEKQGEFIPAEKKGSVMHTYTVTHDVDSTPVTIGSSIHQPGTPPIVFRGDIDEVYLFYGALDEEGIRVLMEKNDPRMQTE
ncbi:LamG-like jellyroll fold domain-containing protein [Sulfuriroseicoccus oceanibius]|uniref:FecR protein domain-containing protein n=1 Tax=Sulfuriroseicoccus oceanibius TaxID=2707525 RepID=A0A6B3L3P7_9BACT|nr:LamG-like jellyroll fold domain-containing protein [Sulfuriroseicoccus oceanibius]QQL44666.1 hypothetical protein G3M56_012370 [Sulfuriroseicoccus oceanibius]